MKFLSYIPVIGQLVDLGFYIADGVRKRKAEREAKRKAEEAAKRKAPRC